MADGFTLNVTDGALGAGPAGPGRALLLIGVCSIAVSAAVVHAFESPSDVLATLGYGRMPEMAAYALSVGAAGATGRPVGCIRVGTTSAGANSAVTATRVSTSTGTIPVTGSAYDDFDVRVRVTRTGTVGVGAFRYSLDGGRSESAEYAIPSGGAFAIPGTGVTVTFTAGAGPIFFEAGDSFAFTSTGPTYDTTALNTALDVMHADARDWPLVVVVGPPGGASDSLKATAAAALAAAVHTKLEAFAGQGRYARALLEGPDVANDATGSGLVTTALATTVARRAGLSGGYCRIPSQINPRQMRVSACWPYAARLAAIPYSQDPGDGGLGPLDGIIGGTLETATTARSVYDAGRVFCLQTINGISGYVVSNSAMLAPTGSDYAEIPNGRVIDEASRAGRAKLLTYRRSRIRVGRAGTPNAGRIDERDAQRIEAAIRSAVERAVLDTGDAVAVTVIVNRTDDLLATNKLRVKIRITPFAYAKTIEAEIGLDNPALQAA